MSAAPLIELSGVSKRFVKQLDSFAQVGNLFGKKFGLEPQKEEVVHAVDKVSLKIKKGEVVGLVGESGCGKSTLGRMAVGLHGLSSGSRKWKGVDLHDLPAHEKKRQQLAMQMIFQDPYASLNPRMRVIDIVGEAPVVHKIISKKEQSDYVDELLQKVGLANGMSQRYAHQFSGGQRARLGIARALAVNPEFLVCDESVAALDVSIQSQVLNLFMQLKANLGLTYLFISHDLGVVRHISDRVVIMYLGRVVEIGTTDVLFAKPNHPYSIALLAAAPSLTAGKKVFAAIKGEIPSPLNPPAGCHFHPRCPQAFARCSSERPLLREIESDRFSACHLNDFK